MGSPRRRLLEQLCATFSNQAQALANPPLYAHIQVVFRPAPQLAAGSLLLEQAYALDPTQPYRIRVLRVCEDSRGLIIENKAIVAEQRFHGATADPSRIATIREDDLCLLEGCTYLVEPDGAGFCGEVEPGCNCRVQRKGSEAYLVSSFRVGPEHLETVDQGFDPVTHSHLWGCLAGPFAFRVTERFCHELPPDW